MKSIFAILSIAGVVLGLPQAPTIISGNVELIQNSSTLEVIASNRSIVNWEDFSVIEGEKAVFTLAASTHAILNRVTGLNESRIFGDLLCNGQMVLINPSGVIFGPNAKIETASLITSSLDILNDDFLNGGELHFLSSNGKNIENFGVISAEGDIYLLAPTIVQKGTCVSNHGEIILASCEGAILNSPDGKIKLLPKTFEGEGIHHGGLLKALQVRLLAEGNLSSLAINLNGIIQVNGQIQSDEVMIEGKGIEIGPNTLIDVSNSSSGGKCKIVADEWITMDPSARIEASSLNNGTGGEVVLFSSGATLFHGDIRAEGGPILGDGGFVEVSGKNLSYKGTVSTKASNGKTGMLLLDPVDITIAGPPSANINGLPNGPFTPVNGSACYGLPGSSVLDAADLVLALGANSVTIDTVGSVGACPGHITFDSPVNYNSAFNLILNAAGSIRFNASVINSGTGGISISNAGIDVIVQAAAVPVSVETTGGPISITNVTGGLFIFGGTAMNAFAQILATGAALDVSVTEDVFLQGGSQSGANASLLNSIANLTILNATSVVVNGGTNSGAQALIRSGSNGNALITCGSMLVNTTASGAPAGINGDGDLTLNITSGDLQILADSGGFAGANGSFGLNATVSGNIILTGNNGGFAALFGDRTSATVESVNGSVIMNGVTQMYAGNQPNASLLVIAGVDILANGTASFDTFSPTGTVTLVIDNLFPTSPGFGAGQFVLSMGSTVNAGGNAIQIFTADPSQNTINGNLNGVPFTLGPPLTDTNTERYGIYFPNPFFVSDYVVFYKTPTTAEIETIIVALTQPELADFSEMFRILHPYSEYIYGSIRFTETYQNPEALFGLLEKSDDLFRLRKKSSTREWQEIVYDPAKF